MSWGPLGQTASDDARASRLCRLSVITPYQGIAVIAYGQFIKDIIGFLIVALAISLIVKQVNRIKSSVDKPSVAEAVTKERRFCASTISLEASRCPDCTSDLGPAGVRR